MSNAAAPTTMVLKISLEKMLSETYPPQKYKELRDVITQCLQVLTGANTNSTNPPSEFFWVPFKLACSSGIPKLRSIALDSIQKLVAFKIFSGSTKPFEIEDVMVLEPTKPQEGDDAPFSPTSTTSRLLASRRRQLNEQQKNAHRRSSGQLLLLDDIVATVCSVDHVDNDDELFLQLIKVLLTLVTSCDVKGMSLLSSIQTVFRIYLLSTRHRVNHVTAKAALSQMVNTVFTRYRDETKGENQTQESQNQEHQTQHSILDSLMLLRYLCEVTQRSESETEQQTSLMTRIVAYELILSALNQAGATMSNNPLFVQFVKNELVLSLSSTGVSSHPGLFELSLSVFLMVLHQFHPSLKAEVEVLLNEIYIRILASATSTTGQKAMVLQGLTKLFSYPQYLLDVYVNYDCDMAMESLYEKIVHLVSQQLNDSDELIAARALQCINAIVSSLDEWTVKKELAVGDTSRSDSPFIQPKNPLTLISMQMPLLSLGEAANNSTAEEDPALYEEMTIKKKSMKEAIILFNSKPVKGINLLVERGLIEDTSEQKATFILKTASLSKKAIGEFIGEGIEACVKVMHAMVDAQDFTGMLFVDALRSFLQLFRLPGEAQKIDRIMEKFAERYYACNPDVFANADTVYTLAYSVIMLNTDQHSPQVKNRMQKSDFIKNNRGINNNSDLPDEFLGQVYDEINAHEIVLEDERKAVVEDGDYATEVAQMKAKSEARFKGPRPPALEFRHASLVQHAKPMFQVGYELWKNGLVALFEKDSLSDTVLSALSASTRIACFFDQSSARNELIQSLAKFCTGNSITEKNVAAMKCLIQLSLNLGNYFDENWNIVLEMVTKIEDYGEKKLKRTRLMDDQNHTVAVDKIFSNTAKLDGRAVVHFFTALSNVCMQNIERGDLRVFALQRIVEIVHYNMDRIRLEWTQIWKVLAPFFNHLGAHSDEAVATFAVNALRQLSLKLLERKELSHFHTQSNFLKSFEHVIKLQQSKAVREQVLYSLSQLILLRGADLKSGWKSIFIVLSRAAVDKEESVLLNGFDLMNIISKDYMTCLGTTLMDYIQAVIEFATSHRENVVAASLKWMVAVANRLRNEEQMDQDAFFLYCFPLISGALRVLSENHNDILVLKSLMSLLGDKFTQEYWKTILRSTLLPLFDDVKNIQSNDIPIMVWLTLLGLMLDWYVEFPLLREIDYLESVMNVVTCMINQEALDVLGQTALGHVHEWLMRHKDDLCDNDWVLMTRFIVSWYASTVPEYLLETAPPSSPDQSSSLDTFSRAYYHCAIQLTLLQLTKDVLFGTPPSYSKLTPREQQEWRKALERAYTFANTFNNNHQVRLALFKAGFMPQLDKVILIKQETLALSLLLDSLFLVLDREQNCLTEFVTRCIKLLENVKSMAVKDPSKYRKDILAWIPLLEWLFGQWILLLDCNSSDASSNDCGKNRTCNDGKIDSTDPSTNGNPVIDVSSVLPLCHPPSPVTGALLRPHLERFFQIAVQMMMIDELRPVLQKFMGKIGTQFLTVQE